MPCYNCKSTAVILGVSLGESAVTVTSALAVWHKWLLNKALSLETGKNRRLKQAKEEAQEEIEQYRLQREKEFKAKEEAALGSHGSCSTEIEKETQMKMSTIQDNFQKNREKVLNNLLMFVCDIKPEIHMNYRING
uniref:V-type proton ATPase subunit G n=1 Tax=Pelodiscus sinensis TaxID=13735 RepID=K7GER7_PELSI|nr:V-type proton ATPase subunit G 1 [Pelodiscus sinensis]|eukprot:XP_006137244.1 V-type proton ATPase subunit G 1 [Pelodiscus sinensis]